MKNKLIKIACICLMIVSLSIIFMGCSDENKSQITIAQIEDAIVNAQTPTFAGASSVNKIELLTTDNLETYTNDCIRWQQNFEDNNIDTTEFMSMSKMRCRVVYNQSESKDYYIYVFKFNEDDDAEDCYKKLNKINILEKFDYSTSSYKTYKYKAKQYGNLVVYVYDEMANYIFNIIDNIKAK